MPSHFVLTLLGLLVSMYLSMHAAQIITDAPSAAPSTPPLSAAVECPSIGDTTLIEIFVVISLLLNLYPIVSLLIFPVLRKHVFNQVLLNICTCTFFLTLSALITLQTSTTACFASRLGYFYFLNAMQYWTATLMYLTYKVFMCEKVTFSPKIMSLASWGFPALSIGMLYTCGKMDFDNLCNFVPINSQDETALTVIKAVFFVLPSLTVEAFSLFLSCKIIYRYFVLKLMSKQIIWKIVSTLLIYQVVEYSYVIGLIVSYLKNNETFTACKRLSPLQVYVFTVSYLLGPVYSLVFLFTNRESRKRWGRCFSNLCTKGGDMTMAWRDSGIGGKDALGQQEQFDPDRKETELTRHRLSDMSDYRRDSDLELMDADYAEIDTSAIMEDGRGSFSIFSSGESN